MTTDYILSHTPRQICRNHTMDEIETAFAEYSPLSFASFHKIMNLTD